MFKSLWETLETAARRIRSGHVVSTVLVPLFLFVFWIIGPLFDEMTAYHYHFKIVPEEIVYEVEDLRERLNRIDESVGNAEEKEEKIEDIRKQILESEIQLGKAKSPSGGIVYGQGSEISGYFHMRCNSTRGIGRYRLRISVGEIDLMDKKSMKRLDGRIEKHIMSPPYEGVSIVGIDVGRNDETDTFSCELDVILYVRDMSFLTRLTKWLVNLIRI